MMALGVWLQQSSRDQRRNDAREHRIHAMRPRRRRMTQVDCVESLKEQELAESAPDRCGRRCCPVTLPALPPHRWH